MLWQYYKCSIYHPLSCLTQLAQAESTLSREDTITLLWESVLYKVYLGPLSVVKFKCTSCMCMCIYYTPKRQIESPAHTYCPVRHAAAIQVCSAERIIGCNQFLEVYVTMKVLSCESRLTEYLNPYYGELTHTITNISFYFPIHAVVLTP